MGACSWNNTRTHTQNWKHTHVGIWIFKCGVHVSLMEVVKVRCMDDGCLTNILNMINHLYVETKFVMKIWVEVCMFEQILRRSNNCKVEFSSYGDEWTYFLKFQTWTMIWSTLKKGKKIHKVIGPHVFGPEVVKVRWPNDVS